MANVLTSNPMLIDTWSADFEISSTPIRVKKIRLLSAADGDVLVLENKLGEKVVYLVQEGASDVVEVDFGDTGFLFNSLQCDVSDCTGIGANDLMWIYII